MSAHVDGHGRLKNNGNTTKSNTDDVGESTPNRIAAQTVGALGCDPREEGSNPSILTSVWQSSELAPSGDKTAVFGGYSVSGKHTRL